MIGAQIHYPSPIHLLPAFRVGPYGVGTFPVAEKAASMVVSLPIFPGMTFEEVQVVVDAVLSSKE
jgi:dTDP-4-amino-4,6-dideoxygalactose transaminase